MECCFLCLASIPFVFVAICLIFRFWYRSTSVRCTSTRKMNGKTVIITGANTGIGYAAAKDIASRGARIILACRTKEKAEKTRDTIINETKNQNIFVKIVDVSDLNSIRKFCKSIQETEKRLDVLINNAGGAFSKRNESAQGYELTLATNHYGHFLMTGLLLDLLKKSSPSRIINVSSRFHNFPCLDINDLHFIRRKYGILKSYAQSKLCQILFTKELSHKLTGTGVTVNALHPGAVHTDIISNERSLLTKCVKFISWICYKDSVLGAQTTIHLAVADEVEKISGEYFVDCKIAKCSKKASDPGLAKKLWEITEEEVGLTKEEKFRFN